MADEGSRMAHTHDDDGWSEGPGLLESMWSHRGIVVAGLVLGLAAGYLFANQQDRVYEATTRVMLADPRNAGAFPDLRVSATEAGRHVRNQAEQMTSQAVLGPAAEALGDGTSWTDLDVTAEPSEDTDSITVKVRHGDPDVAAGLANSIVDIYDEMVAEDVRASAQRTVSQLAPTEEEYERQLLEIEQRLLANPDSRILEDQYRLVSDQLAEVRRRARAAEVDAALFGGGIRHHEAAVVPEGPIQPQPRRNALAGGLLGLALAAGLAWWLNARQRDVAIAVRELYGAPLLGEVPDFGRALRLPLRKPQIDLASGMQRVRPEPYEFLATSVTLALRDAETSIAVVTSMVPGEGKSLTAVNLAIAAARTDKRVLLLDADLHRSELASVVPALTEGPGLADLVRGDAFVDTAAKRWAVPDAQELHVMRLGRRGAAEPSFLRTDPFRRWMRLLGSRFDLVVVDAPPVLPVLDAIDLAEPADGIILVVTPDTTEASLAKGQQRLAHTPTPVVGYVLNRSGGDLPIYAYAYEPRDSDAPDGDDGKAISVVAMRPPEPAPSDVPGGPSWQPEEGTLTREPGA